MTAYPTAITLQAPATTGVRAERLFYLDNLRVVLTAAVIAHHVGQAYGPTGGFWPIQDVARSDLLGPFFAVNRSFGMSLFFLIAGYFMVRSYDGHGPRAFVRSRLMRLGVPLMVFMALAVPVMMLLGAPPENAPGGLPEINALHLWFVQHLLLYSLSYAGLRAWLSRRSPGAPAARLDPPGTLVIVLFALALAFASAVVRIWFPIDDWRNLLGFFRVAFADVPRDLGLFIAGALAYRHDWLSRFDGRAGRRWLLFGLALAALWFVLDLTGWSARPTPEIARGLRYAVWESLLCCAMCIGLVVLFRDKLNVATRLSSELSRSQYLAYVIHVIPVLLIEAAVLAVPTPGLVKFAAVSVLATVVTFALASLLRRPLRLS